MTLDSNSALFMQINQGEQRKHNAETEQWAGPRNIIFLYLEIQTATMVVHEN